MSRYLEKKKKVAAFGLSVAFSAKTNWYKGCRISGLVSKSGWQLAVAWPTVVPIAEKTEVAKTPMNLSKKKRKKAVASSS